MVEIKMDQIENLKALMSRMQRYRFSGKTMRYHVYTFMEKYVAIGFVLLLASIWLESSVLKDIVFYNTWVCVMVGVLHYIREALTKPWLILGASAEAFIVYTIYAFWIINYFEVSSFEQFCLFLFVARFWQRGEYEVNLSALENYINNISNKTNPSGKI